MVAKPRRSIAHTVRLLCLQRACDAIVRSYHSFGLYARTWRVSATVQCFAGELDQIELGFLVTELDRQYEAKDELLQVSGIRLLHFEEIPEKQDAYSKYNKSE